MLFRRMHPIQSIHVIETPGNEDNRELNLHHAMRLTHVTTES